MSVMMAKGSAERVCAWECACVCMGVHVCACVCMCGCVCVPLEGAHLREGAEEEKRLKGSEQAKAYSQDERNKGVMRATQCNKTQCNRLRKKGSGC